MKNTRSQNFQKFDFLSNLALVLFFILRDILLLSNDNMAFMSLKIESILNILYILITSLILYAKEGEKDRTF